MHLHRHLGLLYGVLVLLILSIGAWWAYFLGQEGRHYERYRLQLFATDRLHAAFLVNSVPEIAADPEGALGKDFPELAFRRDQGRVIVSIRPEAVAAVRREAARRRRMFLSEGAFLLLLLMAGTTILTVAYRREREFKRARELFLAGATHELKTPLASLRLAAETLARPDLDPSQRERLLEHMVQDLDRLSGLVEQVLAVSRDAEGTSAGRVETFSPAAVVQEVLAELHPFLESHGAKVTTRSADTCRLRGDPRLLQVAVRNLVHNAVVYSPAPAEVWVSVDRSGGHCRITVRDRGPGIPRREQQRIFESFARGSAGARRTGGSGLGLYLVRRNAERLGGRVTLESQAGAGAAFTLELPALPAHAGRSVQEETS